MDDLTVLKAKRLGVYHCHLKEPLLNAAQQMITEDISTLVVVDDQGCLAGILTRTDLVRAYQAHGDDWSGLLAEQVMSRDVVTVSPQDHLHQVVQLLLNNQIHRVVVVEADGTQCRPISVVSAADLVYHMVKAA